MRTAELSIWCSISSALATALSVLIYWQLLVPRLPNYHSVPMIWWLFVCSPVAIVFITAVILRPSNWLAVPLSAALGVNIAWVAIDALRGRSGLPVSHDVFFGTSEYLWSASVRLVVILLFLLFVAWPISAAARLLGRPR